MRTGQKGVCVRDKGLSLGQSLHSVWFYKDQCKKRNGLVLKIFENLPRFWSLFPMTEKVVGPYFFSLRIFYLNKKKLLEKIFAI